MATVVNMGHTIGIKIGFLDQNKNPMLTAVVPDATPAWTNTTVATETLKVAADGLSCEADPVAPGTDTVSMAITVGGVAFSATLDVEVDPAPQVLTSVVLIPTVS